MGSLIRESQERLRQLTGDPLALTTDWNEVLSALDRGARTVIVDLPWATAEGEAGRTELVLERRDGERISYFNPTAIADLASGALVPATARIPERRGEGVGKESMAGADLARLFLEGEGCALVPTLG